MHMLLFLLLSVMIIWTATGFVVMQCAHTGNVTVGKMPMDDKRLWRDIGKPLHDGASTEACRSKPSHTATFRHATYAADAACVACNVAVGFACIAFRSIVHTADAPLLA